MPKDKGTRRSDETHLEWVNKDGNTYLAPVGDREGRINGIHRWDQAFRVYATIYCGANPARSQEIWQYVSVINTAAASYCWDNVANYDFTFRHLMEYNPQQSWATTYNQMWNLSMRDPLPKNNHYAKSFAGNGQGFARNKGFSGGSSSAAQGQGADNSNNPAIAKKKKPDFCKNFNKGLVCKYRNKCRFLERCSHCNSVEHGVINCPQLFSKTGDK